MRLRVVDSIKGQMLLAGVAVVAIACLSAQASQVCVGPECAVSGIESTMAPSGPMGANLGASAPIHTAATPAPAFVEALGCTGGSAGQGLLFGVLVVVGLITRKQSDPL